MREELQDYPQELCSRHVYFEFCLWRHLKQKTKEHAEIYHFEKRFLREGCLGTEQRTKDEIAYSNDRYLLMWQVCGNHFFCPLQPVRWFRSKENETNIIFVRLATEKYTCKTYDSHIFASLGIVFKNMLSDFDKIQQDIQNPLSANSANAIKVITHNWLLEKGFVYYNKNVTGNGMDYLYGGFLAVKKRSNGYSVVDIRSEEYLQVTSYGLWGHFPHLTLCSEMEELIDKLEKSLSIK